MQPKFRRVSRANRSETKGERYFYINRGRNNPQDSVNVLTPSCQTETHAGRHRGDGVRADHLGWAGQVNGCRTRGEGGQLSRQIGATGAAGATDAADSAGNCNSAIFK